MKFLASLFTCFFLSSSVFAAEDFVMTIADDHKVFFRYQEAQPGQPTVVLLNGLIYAIDNWNEYFAELEKSGVGVLQVAYSTQPESLEYLEGETPYYAKLSYSPIYGWLQNGLETQDLINEVLRVVDHLKIQKFHLVSLSYGSIVASQLAHQELARVESLILMAPAVVTSGRYNAYGAAVHAWHKNFKAMGNIYTDYSYDSEIGKSLVLLVTPAKYSFENVEFIDFYSGVYQMARSSKWFDLKDYASKQLPPTYLFAASLEDAPLLRDQMAFWNLMADNPTRRSFVLFDGSFHAIPGVTPKKAAQQTLLAISEKLQPESVVNIEGSNPENSKKQSLLDYSELSEEAWKGDD